MPKQYWIGDILAGSHDEEGVELCGWVHRTRGSNKIRFLVLRDSTGSLQCVIKKGEVDDECFDALSGALIESSVMVTGKVIRTDREHGYELSVSSGIVVLSLIHI